MELVKRLMFLDIETVGVTNTLSGMKNLNKPLYDVFPSVAEWYRRKDKSTKDLSDEELFEKKSGLIPEYCKIICASFGFYNQDHEFVTYTVYGDDEKDLLIKIGKVINRADTTNKILCGHNIIVFDLNVIAKRMMYHGIDIPKNMPKSSQAPWIVDKMVLDTKREYSGGNIFKPSSLKLLCAFFGVESSKDGDVNGEKMHGYYWSDKRDLEKIKEYCERDIEAQHEVTKILINRKIIDENERF